MLSLPSFMHPLFTQAHAYPQNNAVLYRHTPEQEEEREHSPTAVVAMDTFHQPKGMEDERTMKQMVRREREVEEGRGGSGIEKVERPTVLAHCERQCLEARFFPHDY